MEAERRMYASVNKTTIGSNNGLSPGRRQAIIWTSAGILLTEPLGTNFSEIWIKIQIFSFKKMHLKMSSAKWHQFHLCLNVLTPWPLGDVVETLTLNMQGPSFLVLTISISWLLMPRLLASPGHQQPWCRIARSLCYLRKDFNYLIDINVEEWPVLEIPTGPPVRGRQLWMRTGNFMLIFLQFHVYDLWFKAWGPTTFLTEFQTLGMT